MLNFSLDIPQSGILEEKADALLTYYENLIRCCQNNYTEKRQFQKPKFKDSKLLKKQYNLLKH